MPPRIFTIGHSRHTADHFLSLLRQHSIGRLVDVRSQPYSKWAPHFERLPLAHLLDDHGVDYVFLGGPLGGRPDDRSCYRKDGTVDYALRSQASDFRDGIGQLVVLANDRPTTILCAEEDPARCHRRLLITPAIVRLGFDVAHVRGNGRAETEGDALPPIVATQLDLFG